MGARNVRRCCCRYWICHSKFLCCVIADDYQGYYINILYLYCMNVLCYNADRIVEYDIVMVWGEGELHWCVMIMWGCYCRYRILRFWFLSYVVTGHVLGYVAYFVYCDSANMFRTVERWTVISVTMSWGSGLQDGACGFSNVLTSCTDLLHPGSELMRLDLMCGTGLSCCKLGTGQFPVYYIVELKRFKSDMFCMAKLQWKLIVRLLKDENNALFVDMFRIWPAGLWWRLMWFRSVREHCTLGLGWAWQQMVFDVHLRSFSYLWWWWEFDTFWLCGNGVQLPRMVGDAGRVELEVSENWSFLIFLHCTTRLWFNSGWRFNLLAIGNKKCENISDTLGEERDVGVYCGNWYSTSPLFSLIEICEAF